MGLKICLNGRDGPCVLLMIRGLLCTHIVLCAWSLYMGPSSKEFVSLVSNTFTGRFCLSHPWDILHWYLWNKDFKDVQLLGKCYHYVCDSGRCWFIDIFCIGSWHNLSCISLKHAYCHLNSWYYRVHCLMVVQCTCLDTVSCSCYPTHRLLVLMLLSVDFPYLQL